MFLENGRGHKSLLYVFLSVMVVLVLAGCARSAIDTSAVNYEPTSKVWPISTPAEEGLDPELVAQLYYNASQLPTVYSLLVFKNDKLIADGLFQ